MKIETKNWINPTKAALFFGVSEKTIFDWINDDTILIKTVKVGSHKFYNLKDLKIASRIKMKRNKKLKGDYRNV